MSGNSGVPSVPPHPRRIVTALSKLTDPQNTAEPIPSHKHAIEWKRAAESANKKLGDAASGGSGPPDSSFSTSPPPTVFPLLEAWTNTNKPNPTTEKADVGGEDSGDEPIERHK